MKNYIYLVGPLNKKNWATNAISSEYSALTFELDKPDDDKEKSLVEKAIQCNVQKLIRKYNKTATNENVEPHLNQSCSNPIQYDESQFCIEVMTNSGVSNQTLL